MPRWSFKVPPTLTSCGAKPLGRKAFLKEQCLSQASFIQNPEFCLLMGSSRGKSLKFLFFSSLVRERVSQRGAGRVLKTRTSPARGCGGPHSRRQAGPAAWSVARLRVSDDVQVLSAPAERDAFVSEGEPPRAFSSVGHPSASSQASRVSVGRLSSNWDSGPGSKTSLSSPAADVIACCPFRPLAGALQWEGGSACPSAASSALPRPGPAWR